MIWRSIVIQLGVHGVSGGFGVPVGGQGAGGTGRVGGGTRRRSECVVLGGQVGGVGCLGEIGSLVGGVGCPTEIGS